MCVSLTSVDGGPIRNRKEGHYRGVARSHVGRLQRVSGQARLGK